MAKKTIVYVVARNGSDRPTLQHKLVDGTATRTLCGRDISSWSRAYQASPIDVILCRQRGCRS